MKRFNDMRDIQTVYDFCQLQAVGKEHYMAVIPSGLFPQIFDYGRGFLSLEIKRYPVWKTDDYHIACSIRSIDDDGARIYCQDEKAGKSYIRLEKLVTYFREGLKSMSFGTMAEIQANLEKLGFYYDRW